jgi:hypothetical protein
LLATVGRIQNDEVIPALLAGLPTTFSMVVTVIESSEEELAQHSLVSTALMAGLGVPSPSEWFVDSGVTHHLCCE